MIGFNLGSLNSTISFGEIISASRMNCNLLISDISGRSTPSVISYTKSHRLIGEQANLIIKKFLLSSFNNISRLTGMHPASEFAKKEIGQFSLIGCPFNTQTNSFNFQLDNEEMKFSADQIVLAFINLLKQELIINKKIPVESYVFSVPDYFTCNQKSSFMSILKAAGLEKNCHIIQESTAITLYFGYKKYKDYFIVQNAMDNNPKSVGVNPTLVKYIIFIDAGYSKTTFVFSKLSFNQFSVLKSYCMPFLGGRNFDQKIFNFCANKMQKEKGIDLTKNKKSIIRLLQVISKARKNLTVNTEAPINADSIYEDNDFSYELTRVNFSKIVKEELDSFENYFAAFYNECQEMLNKEGLLVTNIEMAGELMRTPALQEIVKKVAGIEISKGILTDECIAIGCSLYGAIMKGAFPVQNFQGIYHVNNYSIYQSINGGKLTPFLLAGDNIPIIKNLSYSKNELKGPTLRFAFYHDKKELAFYIPAKTGLLIEYEINIHYLLSQYKGLEALEISFLIDNNGFVHIHGINYKEKGKSNPLSGQNLSKIIKVTQRELYLQNNIIEDFVKRLKAEESKMLKKDIKFKTYLEKVNQIEGRCYEVKNKINNKNLSSMTIRGKNVMDILQDIEDGLSDSRDNIIDLKNYENSLDEILSAIIPGNIIKIKAELRKKIKDYGEKLNVELINIIEGKNSKLTQEEVDRISSMLNHFSNKLELCDDINVYNELKKEFDNEMKAYSFVFEN
ncbi:MAG: Hsp70 family protein [archaeon]|nr:Hsp70 family protein [archaeon]